MLEPPPLRGGRGAGEHPPDGQPRHQRHVPRQDGGRHIPVPRGGVPRHLPLRQLGLVWRDCAARHGRGRGRDGQCQDRHARPHQPRAEPRGPRKRLLLLPPQRLGARVPPQRPTHQHVLPREDRGPHPPRRPPPGRPRARARPLDLERGRRPLQLGADEGDVQPRLCAVWQQPHHRADRLAGVQLRGRRGGQGALLHNLRQPGGRVGQGAQQPLQQVPHCEAPRTPRLPGQPLPPPRLPLRGGRPPRPRGGRGDRRRGDGAELQLHRQGARPQHRGRGEHLLPAGPRRTPRRQGDGAGLRRPRHREQHPAKRGVPHLHKLHRRDPAGGGALLPDGALPLQRGLPPGHLDPPAGQRGEHLPRLRHREG
mmetsp:Transcript_7917/g.20374  ORF Transcript_7917/g.20374 Transcript_7917/m.20374 type:complete len:367 (+) Transcript_7917:1698-2798(+)